MDDGLKKKKSSEFTEIKDWDMTKNFEMGLFSQTLDQ